jgi:hypothetical protein
MEANDNESKVLKDLVFDSHDVSNFFTSFINSTVYIFLLLKWKQYLLVYNEDPSKLTYMDDTNKPWVINYLRFSVIIVKEK